MGLLDGKVALITGGASGQGAAEARLFVDEGAAVVIGDVQDVAGRALADELGPSATFVHLDVSSDTDWEAAIAHTSETFGDATILIQSAAIVHHRLIEDSPREEFERVLAVNLLGPYLGMRAVLPGMQRAGGGVIINVGSAAAYNGTGGRALYGAAKWGLRGLTKSASIEFGYHNIRVNSIHPGAIDTPMLRNSDQEMPAPQIPVARFGRADEVARTVLFLVSDHAAYITGADVPIDGGASTGGWVRPREVLRAAE
jgi:3alpha(or 20beta)-hydroxysteroid dehydrogenase